MTATDYAPIDSQLCVLLQDETDALASACNFVALLKHTLDDINWVGIYVLRGDKLVLGPFQGKPACVHIALGSGVCGTAAATLQTQRIADVHCFDRHITCDTDSRSELVVPLLVNDRLLGVLDIDSPTTDRFTDNDEIGIENLCKTFCDLQQARNNFI